MSNPDLPSEMVERVTRAIGTYFFRMWRSTATYAVMRSDAWDGPPVKADLTVDEARDLASRLNAEAVIEAMREPTEAMLNEATGALRRHIDALPPEVRARSKEKGGIVLVGSVEKHAIRWRAMIDAALGKP